MNRGRRAVSVAAVLLILGVQTVRAQVLTSPSQWPAGVQQLLDRFASTASSATTLNAAGRAARITHDATFLNAFGGRTDRRPAIDSTRARIYGGGQFRQAKIERLD